MADVFSRNVHCVLGLPFDAVDLLQAAHMVGSAAANRERCILSTPNLNWVVACQHDSALRNSVIDSDLSVADGMPLVWVARWLGIPIRERVAGSAVFEVLRSSKTQRLSVYFFGGPDGIAEVACQRLNHDAGSMTCAGYVSPGFGTVDQMSSPEIIQSINASRADFIVVALGARKGQEWIERNRAELAAPVISHLGAVVNFVAGTINRAPVWMQRFGMEWLWRIKEENSLWRRYFSDGVTFLRLLLTRVLPYRLLLLTHRPGLRAQKSSPPDIHDQGDAIFIRLSGFLVAENLSQVRECFSRSAKSSRNVCIDLAAVTFVDSAFVGLLLLLSGECRRRGRTLDVISPTARVRRILRYSCVEYLLRDRAGKE